MSIKYLIFTIRDITDFSKNRVSGNKDMLADILDDQYDTDESPENKEIK
jgi:hypothetical protein